MRQCVGVGDIGDCGLRRRASRPPFSLDGLPATIAFDVQLEDLGVVDEAIDGGERHGGIALLGGLSGSGVPPMSMRPAWTACDFAGRSVRHYTYA